MIYRACKAYLAFVISDLQDSVLKIRDIPVIREFSNVFSDELPGLPHDKEIAFAIEI